jgi:hypothetical protein
MDAPRALLDKVRCRPGCGDLTTFPIRPCKHLRLNTYFIPTRTLYWTTPTRRDLTLRYLRRDADTDAASDALDTHAASAADTDISFCILRTQIDPTLNASPSNSAGSPYATLNHTVTNPENFLQCTILTNAICKKHYSLQTHEHLIQY